MSQPALIGRAHELAALTAAMSTPGTVALVAGEAGIGKTRLVQEALAASRPGQARTVVMACPPLPEPFTLGPVVDALRQAVPAPGVLRLSPLAGALRPLFPEWANDLPPTVELLEDATASRHRLFRALLEVFDRIGVGVLVVEDVQWADVATLEFLISIVARSPLQRTVVLTHRTDEAPADPLLVRLSSRIRSGAAHRRITLRPLDADGTGALVSSMLGGERVSAEFAGFIHKRTEGVPLAVEEVVRLMHDRGQLVRRGEAWVRRPLQHIDVPPTIRDAVRERTDQLSPVAHAVVRAASVLGAPADVATLAEVSGLPAADTDAGVAEALRSGLLGEGKGGTLSFRHVLARLAASDDVPAPERRALHLRAGRALERLVPSPSIRLAHHYRAAGHVGAWCHHAELAADLAIRSGDETAAAAILHGLLVDAPLAPEDVLRLTAKLPLTSLRGEGRYAALVGVLRATLDGRGLSAESAYLLRFHLGRVHIVTGAYEAGWAQLQSAAPHLSPTSTESVRARIYLGLPLGAVRPVAEHRGWLADGIELHPSTSPREHLQLMVERTTALLLLGDDTGWREARRIPAQPATPGEAAAVVLGHLNIGHLAMLWGRYAEADSRLRDAGQLAKAHGFARLVDGVGGSRGRLDWLTGAWQGLAERMAALMEDEEVQPATRGEAAFVAGSLHAAAGDASAAEASFTFVRDEAVRRGAVEGVIESAAALGRLWLAEGRIDAALDVTREAADITVHKGLWVLSAEVVPVHTAALVAAERADEAAAFVAAFGSLLSDCDAPAPRAALATCQALVAAAGAGTAALFAVAAALWEALPRPYDALLARERQARGLVVAGEREDGLGLLSATARALRDLGAAADAERAEGVLRGYGHTGTRVPRGGRPSYGDRLSPRETEVVRLLVAGLTNPQIAGTLVVSPRTVASQVRSAMRKLNVASRTALAVRAVEQGLVDGPADDRTPGSRPRS